MNRRTNGLDLSVSFQSNQLSEDLYSSSHEKAEHPEQPLAGKETQAVNKIKLVVVLVLAISTIGIALGVYFFVSGSEQGNFEAHFNDGAQKILGAIGRNVGVTYAALDALIVSMVSFAKATNQTWPFVTIPDFAVRAAKIRSLSNLIYINHLPLVTQAQRLEWEDYTLKHGEWVNESMAIQEQDDFYYGPIMEEWNVTSVVHGDFGPVAYNETRDMLPTWQNAPTVPVYFPYNYDYFSVTMTQSLYAAVDTGNGLITEAYGLPDPNNEIEVIEANLWYDWYSNYIPETEDPSEPMSDVHMPIFETVDSLPIDPTQHKVVGLLVGAWFWRDVLKDLLPVGSQGFVVVFENPCNPSFTYQLNGPTTKYLGRGDLHQAKFDDFFMSSLMRDLDTYSISKASHTYVPINEEYCPFKISVYPSDEMKEAFMTKDPVIYMVIAIAIFLFTTFLFVTYDFTVRRRHMVVMDTAVSSNALVSSLFPEVVRDRIKQSHKKKSARKKAERKSSRDQLTLLRRDMISGSFRESSEYFTVDVPVLSPDEDIATLHGNPIAEVYPETTVMIADIFGFSPWSSAREPTKVFFLLEAIYSVFDELSSRYGVFKIESVGDMYVVVSGLPEPEKRHAVIMAQFAQDCKEKMKRLVLGLERRLGPGTGDLRMRIGLNSGPTTGGVLRSEKSIFQIFGDTVNVAAKMQRTAFEDSIQCSQRTADELINGGREHWVKPRLEPFMNLHDDVENIQTYWVEPPFELISTASSVDSDDLYLADTELIEQFPAYVQRLVTWNLDQLERILVKLLVQSSGKQGLPPDHPLVFDGSKYPRSERSETIFLLNSESSSAVASSDAPVLDNGIRNLLIDFISSIAFMYQENKTNPYHDFERSTNAAMSTMKLLANLSDQEKAIDRDLDRRITYTHLILSDPMVQFSMIFSVLIHALEHPGLPNSQLVKENSLIAKRYGGKSAIEQHSLDTAWDLFMDPGYRELRACIFKKPSDILEFRKLVVNVVMATDLQDVELMVSRDARWKELFEENPSASKSVVLSEGKDLKKDEYNHNRRATLVIEYIIQASVVSEYMQHWKIYEKRRKRHFVEMADAYKRGRLETDPSETWYEKELFFFDDFVLPLLDKIKRCGVFGSSCGEMSGYAVSNRREWKSKGKDLIEKWKQGTKSQRDSPTNENHDDAVLSA